MEVCCGYNTVYMCMYVLLIRGIPDTQNYRAPHKMVAVFTRTSRIQNGRHDLCAMGHRGGQKRLINSISPPGFRML